VCPHRKVSVPNHAILQRTPRGRGPLIATVIPLSPRWEQYLKLVLIALLQASIRNRATVVITRRNRDGQEVALSTADELARDNRRDRPSTMRLRFAVALTPMNVILMNVILSCLKQELTDLYGDRLLHLTLFGSQARGDAEFGSDIDVLVFLKSPVNPGSEIKRTGKTIADLSLRYDVVISCLFMDETSCQTRNGSLLRNVRKEGILL
jgi:uncharacterized protein